MKRKLLSVLLTFCLAFSLLPTAALADEAIECAGGETCSHQAAIGSTHYDTLKAAVDAAATGQTVTLLKDAELTETLDINKAITLDGANHKITGVFSTEESLIKVQTDGDFTLTNCIFAPTTKYAKDTAGARTAVYLKVGGNATVTNNTFEGVDNGYRNAIEFGINDDPALKGANISGNTFKKTIQNNYFNFYNMAEGAVINITNNQFLLANKSSNGIRISNNKNVSATFNLDSNTYTYAATSADSEYEGLILLQDYSKKDAGTQDFTKITINITNLTSPEDAKQILYVYDNQDHIIQTNQPVVKGDSSIEKFFVAKVGDTSYYKTLADAITAASSGDTVTLLKDVTLNLTSNIRVSKNLTLNLNNHSIVNNSSTNHDFYVSAGEFKIIGSGSITAPSSFGVSVVGKTTPETWSQPTAAVLTVGEDVTISAGLPAVFITGNGAVANIYGKLVGTGEYATIQGNGQVNDTNNFSGTKINIYDGAEVTKQNGAALYIPQGGMINVYGGTIVGESAAIGFKSGTLNVTGGVIKATGEDSTPTEGWSNGINASGAAIQVESNKGYIGNADHTKYSECGDSVKISISGDAVIESVNGFAVYEYLAAGTVKTSVEKLEITGGYLKSADGKTNIKVSQQLGESNAVSVTGGYFTSDPSDYVADGHYVDASNNGDYPYTVKVGTKPAGALIVVKDATDVTVPDSEAIKGLTTEDKTNISQNTKVDGVAEAVAAKKTDLIPKSVDTSAATKVEVEVSVKVEVKSADLSGENAAKTLTFEAKPVATIKVDGNVRATNVAVPNSLLSGNITVKLPLPEGFTPEQIKHISSDRSVEYFLGTAKSGAKTFEIKDGCAVFTITKFSTFELSGKVTYVAPSYSGGSSSYDPTYSVSTPSKTEHGTVTVSPKNASKGDRVTVTVKPDSGYVLETLTVTDKNGNELTLKDKGNGKYTFTMPAGKVEVKATFMEDNSMLNFFYDVPNNAYFYEAVKWAVKNGITTGVGNNLFAPEQPCTRAQIVTFLWRAAGSPEPKGAAFGMTDVVSGSYYEKAVAWAIENGITTGTTTSTFSPDATCTRAQAVTFLARALKAKAASAAEFSDVPTDSYFADAVAWAAANGVTEGIGGGLFGSDNDCTRGQIVTFLYRAYNK